MTDVILLGKGELCVRILRWFLDRPEWHVQAVVPVIPEPDWTESLVERTATWGIPLVYSGDYHDLPEGAVDLVLSVFYDRILSAEFIASHRRVLNLHNSPLPKYRGVSPIKLGPEERRADTRSDAPRGHARDRRRTGRGAGELLLVPLRRGRRRLSSRSRICLDVVRADDAAGERDRSVAAGRSVGELLPSVRVITVGDRSGWRR